MAELTPLDEKLAEVLGLAQAAQEATKTAAGLEGADDYKDQLATMREQSKETEQRTNALVDTLEGRKTAIRDKARETKQEGIEMMQSYLGGEDADALDGFEFLSMTEAGELAHWEIVQTIAEAVGDTKATELADWAVPLQRGHIDVVHGATLALAAEEAKEMVSA
jgi:hypothetical protein